MGEYVRVSTSQGVQVEKTTDAMLDKISQQRDELKVLRIEVAELRALEAIHRRTVRP